MKTIRFSKEKKPVNTGTRDEIGPDQGKKSMLRGAIAILIESLLAGFSLYAAFLIQKIFFDFQNQQFLFGQGELIRMSLGVASCYAFFSVLRRSYLSGGYGRGRESLKQLARIVTESYLAYLVLLFIVKDINFISAKLALAMGFILTFATVLLYRFVFTPVLFKEKIRSGRRKMVLVKKASPVVPEGNSIGTAGIRSDFSAVPHEDSNSEFPRMDMDIDETSGDYAGATHNNHPDKGK